MKCEERIYLQKTFYIVLKLSAVLFVSLLSLIFKMNNLDIKIKKEGKVGIVDLQFLSIFFSVTIFKNLFLCKNIFLFSSR